MSVERTYQGDSKDGNFKEALERAIQGIAADIGEGEVRDASVSWVVTEISGKYGGFAGFHSVNVKINAKRSPDWEGR